jgi:hypothetical protein
MDGTCVQEDGQSSALVRTSETGKPGLVKAGLGRVCVLWALVPVCVKRSLGLMFDLTCLWIVWLLPCIFHGLLSFGYSEQEFAQMTAPLAGANWLMRAVLTPISLISWRFFCKVVMLAETPGELLSGYSAVSKRQGIGNWCDQIGFGFWLYVMCLVGNCFASIPYVLLGYLTTNGQIYRIWNGNMEAAILPSFGYVLVMTGLLSVFFLPASKGSLDAGVDRLCGLRVVRANSQDRLTPRTRA